MHDRALDPAKPTLDGEPRYEALMADFYMRGANPALHFDDYDVRLAAYRALLAGAAGHTYGNNNIWQMWAPGRDPVLGANTPWNEAIDHPGAFQMGHLRRLVESRPWETLVPAQDLLVVPNPPGDGFVRAAVASDRSFAFVYSPRGEPVAVHQDRLRALDLTAWWFDPRYGRAHFALTGVGTAIQVFTPPSSGRGCDWVVVSRPRSGGGARRPHPGHVIPRAPGHHRGLDTQSGGVTDVRILDGGVAAWSKAGNPTASSSDIPADRECIAYLFFVHDRHAGNRESMKQYLAWETGLMAQLAAQDRTAFKVGAPD